ncbi:hypothetical protein HPB52_010388 [Rhipicephalus sanguineus]|uniref:Uncharacterized protein n=1 Tax=Rhipicephalus sanguineus TaxID=34632 RepID=A0A9D4T5J2_RHISA|nr:hypothetical protein HPB52_010388 [Rhipicephalus sanguineus]
MPRKFLNSWSWTCFVTRQQLNGRKAIGGHNFVTSGWVSEPRMKQVAADSGIIMTQACSHIAALLFYVEYGLRAREERSCTDGSKSWFPPAMKKLEVRSVAETGLSSSAMKKWRIDPLQQAQLVHRSFDRDQVSRRILIAAGYRPAVSSTYVSSVRSSKERCNVRARLAVSGRARAVRSKDFSVTLPQESHFDGRLDAGLRTVVAANGLPSFELLSRYKTRPQDHKFANVGGIDERVNGSTPDSWIFSLYHSRCFGESVDAYILLFADFVVIATAPARLFVYSVLPHTRASRLGCL